MRRKNHTPFSRWMHDKGLTAPGLAVELGVTRSAVYGWASGRWLPTMAHLQKLSQYSVGEVGLELFVGNAGDNPAAAASGSATINVVP